MDRYNIHHNEAGQCLEECVEPDGEWVTYDDAITELEELMKELTYEKGAYKDVYSGNATPNQLKADAIREMMKEVKYNKGSKSFSEARILKYIESMEDK